MENYLVYGQDKQLNNIQINKIASSFLQELNEFNFITISFEETPLVQVIESIDSYDFFVTKRVIVIKDAWFLTTTSNFVYNEKDYDNLINALACNDENTLIIMTVASDKLDTRKKLVKSISKEFKLIKTENYTTEQLRTIISKKINKDGYSIEGEALSLLLQRSSNNFSNLKHDLQKLLLYETNSKHITVKTVKLLVANNIEDSIFDLSTALLKCDIKKMHHCLFELKLLKEEPIKIVVILGNQIRLILQVQKLASLKFSQSEISRILKVHPYRVKIIFADFLYKKNISNMQRHLYELNKAYITGFSKGYLDLELFLIKSTI